MHCGFLLYAFISFLLVNRAFGQAAGSYRFRHITQQDGLVSNMVYAMLQDERGFIWIGTSNGLQRYDGYRFLTYRNEFNPAVKNNMGVNMLDWMKHKKVLICTDNELELSTNTIRPYSKKELLERLADTGNIFKGGGDTIWVTGNRLAYACVGDRITLHNMARDSANDQIWVNINMGLLLLDGKTKRSYTVADQPLRHPLLALTAGIGIKAVTIDNHHNIWINTWVPQFYRYDAEAKKIKSYSLTSVVSPQNEEVQLMVTQVLEDDHHNVWLATSNAGLLKYDPVRDNFIMINSKPGEQPGIQYNFDIFCIMQDREGNLWLGTDKGINIFSPYSQSFQVIRSVPGSPNSLPRREIQCIIQTRTGDILVGTWGGGMVIYDSLWQFRRRISFPGKFEENMVWCFLEDNEGKIWIGCQHGYIIIYDPSSGKISALQPAELQHSTVRCMKMDEEGNILFGLHNGEVAVWMSRQRLFYSYGDSLNNSKLRSAPVYNIYIDQRNNYWTATGDGFKPFNIHKRIFEAVHYPPGNRSGACTDIEADTDSILLVGMIKGGIARFNTRTKTFIEHQPEDQLAASTVHAIRKDPAGNTWFITDYHLYKYHKMQKRMISYAIDPGIVNSSFKSGDFYALQDGRWVIITHTEVLCFSPDSLSAAVPVEITGMKVFDKPFFIDTFLRNNKIIPLSNKENFLTFEFASLHFSNFSQKKYYYKLSGVNSDWVSTEMPVAAYTDLAPGNYTFSVRTEDETDSDQIDVLHFAITPRFWQTWWFRVSAVVSSVCFVYFIIKRRLMVVKGELALKRQIQETEMMALRSQMNPHFIFNCINSIDAMIQSNEKYHATIYLNKFAKLLRNVLDSSKESTVSLAKDLEMLELYIQLEQFRNDNRFVYEISTEAGLLDYDIRVPPLVIQPYVENAILHGFRYRNDNAGKLLVNIQQCNGQLFYIIEDNGVGREFAGKFPAKGKRSYGMNISYDRIRLFNKEDKTNVAITDLYENGRPAGTRVTVGLKID